MTVKWGIIGASGKWTNDTFIPAIISAKNAQIVAICGRSYDITKKVSEKYNIPFFYTNLNDFLRNDDIDVVWIAAPDALHYEHAIACLSANKHILIEKPICQYYVNAREIYELANQNNKQIYVGYHNRYNPLHIKYKKMCDNGEIGPIISIKTTFYANYGYIKDEWKTLNNNPGGWALSHIGTHLIDFIQWFTSNSNDEYPQIQYSRLSSPSFNFESEDYCNIILLFNDTIGMIECSTGMESEYFSRFEIYGTKGYIVLNNTFMGLGSFEHKIYGLDKISGKAAEINPYQLQVETISENIANNTYKLNSHPCLNIKIMEDLRHMETIKH
jgi:predicted dehydrogenase